MLRQSYGTATPREAASLAVLMGMQQPPVPGMQTWKDPEHLDLKGPCPNAGTANCEEVWGEKAPGPQMIKTQQSIKPVTVLQASRISPSRCSLFKLILKVLLIKKEPPTNPTSTWFINKWPASCGSSGVPGPCSGASLGGGFGHPPAHAQLPPSFQGPLALQQGLVRGGLGSAACKEAVLEGNPIPQVMGRQRKPKDQEVGKAAGFPPQVLHTGACHHLLQSSSHPWCRRASKQPPAYF